MELIRANKALGQNFLIDMNIRKKIITAMEIEAGDYVLEIGPGTGSLTELLLDMDVNLKVIEIDERAIQELEKLKTKRNFEIIQADVLKINFDNLFDNQRKVKLIGNLPYNISSQIIFKLFDNYQMFDLAVIMLQKEMARRLVAKKSTKDYGILTVNTELFSKTEILFDVSPNCFIPRPKVTSCISRLKLLDSNQFSKSELKEIQTLIKVAFNQRRKMLSNSLKSLVSDSNKAFEKFTNLRAENLSLADFIEIYQGNK